jgi:hypothetical protein
MLVAHLQQPASPASQKDPVEDPGPAPALDAKDVLAAAERFPWALAAPGERHWPDGAFLDVALSAVRPEERQGYIERLEAFVEQHRERLEELLRAYGQGSTPASHGRYALIGQPGLVREFRERLWLSGENAEFHGRVMSLSFGSGPTSVAR